MRRKIIAMMIICMSIFNIGCSGSKNQENENNNEQSQVESTDNEMSQDEIYSLHKEIMPQIEELFASEGISFTKEKDDRNTKYEGYTKLNFSDTQNESAGAYTHAGYELCFEENGDIRSIGITLYQNIDRENIKNNELKFEDSIFSKITSLVVDDELDYSEVNEDINYAIQNNDEDRVSTVYDNVGESIRANEKEIRYSLVIER